MYIPQHFQEDRPKVLAKAIQSIRFGALVTASADSLQISHVPLLLKISDDGEWDLESHVSRAINHWKLAQSMAHSVAIFQGPQSYISPTWYPTKRETGKVVPTWNYIAIHLHGPIEAIEDETWLLNHVNELTDIHESTSKSPWSVSDAPPEYIAGLARAIVGIRLHVEKIEGSWKMNQNKPEADRWGVIHGLETISESSNVATVMRDLENGRQG